jgi:hypothetical protein
VCHARQEKNRTNPNVFFPQDVTSREFNTASIGAVTAKQTRLQAIEAVRLPAARKSRRQLQLKFNLRLIERSKQTRDMVGGAENSPKQTHFFGCNSFH